MIQYRSNPAWASPLREGPIDPEDIAEFVQFVRALVERYDGDGIADAPGSPVIEHWEIYNEPDGNSTSPPPAWGDDPEKYADLLKAVYPAVKAANPRAKVLFGGVAKDGFVEDGGKFVSSFVSDVLQAGAGPYFDIMNFHAYPAFSFNWASQGPGLYEKAQALRAEMAQFGVNKPIVVTEAGWHSNDHPVAKGSPEIQARYVAELFVQGMAADIDYVIWWMLFDPGGTYPYDNGLVTNQTSGSITNKPAMTAYKTAVDLLSTAHFQRVIPAGELGASDVFAYEFSDRAYNRRLTVAWVNPINSGVKRSIRFAGGSARVYDIYGNASVVSDGADGQVDGRVTVQITAQPKYIEVAQ